MGSRGVDGEGALPCGLPRRCGNRADARAAACDGGPPIGSLAALACALHAGDAQGNPLILRAEN